MIFKAPEPGKSEHTVIERVLEIRKQMRFMLATPRRWSGQMRRLTLARNIRGSNSIEGYKASVEDAIAVVEGEEPLDTNNETRMALIGYRNAMTYVLELSKDLNFKFHEGYIRSLHYMMLAHDLNKHPGNWRPGSIFVRDEQKNEIVYEGPDREHVEGLMEELVGDLNAPSDIPEIIRAAMAHLNLVMIHPFSDGNGRMARCVQTLFLARQGILEPEFCSVEEHLGKIQQEYYDILAKVGAGSYHPERDARPWIRFMLKAHFIQASRVVWRMNMMSRIWEEMELEMGKRQLPERMIFALVDACLNIKVRNASYRTIAQISENLASRDLQTLVKEKLLLATGENRGRLYSASPELLTIRAKFFERFKAEDPFSIPEQEVLPLEVKGP
ncbi:MAG TPA: Fic family protein [Candidatus Angelobacter sp.]